jgi:thiol-disulfide isomerase/thioredoxin
MDKRWLLGGLIGIGGLVIVCLMFFKKTDGPLTGWQWSDKWPGDTSSSNFLAPTTPPVTPPANEPKAQIVAGDFNAALAKSTETGMPVLVYFEADWCVFCKKMKNEVLPDPKVKAVMVNYILVFVDTDKNKALTKKYGVAGIPAYMIANSKGEKLKFGQGHTSASEFAKWLNEPSMFSQPKDPKPEVKPPEKKPEEPKNPRRPFRPRKPGE